MELESLDLKKREAERDIFGFKEEKLKDTLIKEHAKYRVSSQHNSVMLCFHFTFVVPHENGSPEAEPLAD